jgi:hypothetical protein
MPRALWRRALPGLVAGVLMIAAFVFVGTRPGVPTAGRVLALVLGAAMVLLVVAGLAGLLAGGNRRPRHRIDADGIALWSPRGHAEVPWSDVVAVGVGWKRSPVMTAAIKESFALEVFLGGDPDGPLAVTEAPPRAGLPDRRLRLVLAEGDITDALREAVAPYAGDRWLGDYERAWQPLPGS